MHAPSLRRVALVAGSLTAAAAMAVTCAPGAVAATNINSQASAQAGTLRLGTSPLSTPKVSVVWTRGTVGAQTQSVDPAPLLAEQPLLTVGVGAAKAGAGRAAAYSCAGLLGGGGSIVVGNGGSTCRASTPRKGGVSIDLSSITSALPVGIGSVKISANAIMANANYKNGVTSGIGRVDNGSVQVCLGVSLGGTCVGSLLKAPLTVKGTQNEDLLTAVITSLTSVPQLTALLTPLTNALRPVVSLRTNVQSLNPTTGIRTVVGVQLRLLQGDGALSNLAVVTAGPSAAS